METNVERKTGGDTSLSNLAVKIRRADEGAVSSSEQLGCCTQTRRL